MAKKLPKSWGKVKGTTAFDQPEQEEDWEATGQEEMNRLHQECKRRDAILQVRDEINNLRDLLNVCGAALLTQRESPAGHEQLSRNVAHVLYFYVDTKLVELEKELA